MHNNIVSSKTMNIVFKKIDFFIQIQTTTMQLVVCLSIISIQS